MMPRYHYAEGSNPEPTVAAFHVQGPQGAEQVLESIRALLDEPGVKQVDVRYNHGLGERIAVYRKIPDPAPPQTAIGWRPESRELLSPAIGALNMPMNNTEHLLNLLAEELGELAKQCLEIQGRISKAQRFGLDEIEPGQPLTNAQRIAEMMPHLTTEYADVWAVAELNLANDVLPIDTDCYGDSETLRLLVARKKRKVDRYLEFSAARGMVDGFAANPDFPHPEAKPEPEPYPESVRVELFQKLQEFKCVPGCGGGHNRLVFEGEEIVIAGKKLAMNPSRLVVRRYKCACGKEWTNSAAMKPD